MNQNEQMPIQSPVPLSHAEFKVFKLGWLECLAAHVNKTPKTQHVEADASNKARNLDMMREALRQNVRAFRHMLNGEIKYLLSNDDCESDYEDVMIIPNLTNEIIDQALAAEPAPLVRLTEDEIKALPFSVSCTHIYYNEAVPDRDSCMEWANAIMDAFLQKNGVDK